ncbi:LacI family transcriptional regulator [Agromyces aurantiacus]|nr:LacI family transcriptional regulator [Agromyces aurantiacus]
MSPTTVSHAFSGTRTVAPETRERVLQAAAVLGYAPNRVARGLRLRRTGVIGLASDRIATTPFAGRIIEGAQEVAREHGLLLVVADSGGDDQHESRLLRSFVDQRVDGILLARMFHQVVAEPRDLAGVPSVLVDAVPEPGWRVPAIAPDEVGVAVTAVERLLAAGHRRIAAATTVDDSPATRGRAAGFGLALERAGLDPKAALVAESTSDAAGGRAAGRRLLDRPPGDRPTAVFCFNDQMAMGVYQVAAALGLDIPGDLSVIGVDDLDLVAAALDPGLTTVALPHREMGRWGMATLLGLIEDRTAPAADPVLLECELIERGSVGSP